MEMTMTKPLEAADVRNAAWSDEWDDMAKMSIGIGIEQMLSGKCYPMETVMAECKAMLR